MIYPTSEYVKTQCLKLCRGEYQRNIIEGYHRWSGSDIKNKWGANYYRSRAALRDRIEEYGLSTLDVEITGRVFLVVGTSMDECESVTDISLDEYWV